MQSNDPKPAARHYAQWHIAESLLLTWGPRKQSDARTYAALATALQSGRVGFAHHYRPCGAMSCPSCSLAVGVSSV
jgi:hypothetical protein